VSGEEQRDERSLIEKVVDALHRLPVRVSPFLSKAARPSPGSRAALEEESTSTDLVRLQMVRAVRRRCLDALRIASDSVDGTSRLLQSPPLMSMPGPVIRAGLEAAGLVCWLSEYGLSSDQRIQRYIAVRKDDLARELDLSRIGLEGATQGTKAVLEEAVKYAKTQLEEFQRKASQTHLPAVPLPKYADLAAICVAAYEYRMLTSLSHGSPFVYNVVDTMFRGRSPIENSPGIIFFHHLATSADAYCRAVWSFSRYVFDDELMNHLRALLEETYDSLGMLEEPRSYFRGG